MLDRLKDQIGRRQDELIGLTRDLVAFPTVNPPGEAYMECAEHLGERLRRRGFEVRYIRGEGTPGDSERYPRTNVLARFETGRPGPCIHFNGHIDVVTAGLGWTRDPFGGEVADGRIYGRGTCDMKAGIAAAVIAAEALVDSGIGLCGAIEISGTVDEESGGFGGVAYMARQGLFSRPRVDHVIIPEPLNVDRVCIGHRGVWWAEITTHGRIAHGSMPFLGDCAIRHMGAFLERVEHELLPALAARRTAMPVVPEGARASTLNINAIHGGMGEDHDGLMSPCVPDSCRLTIDRRFLPEESLDEVRGEVVGILDELRRSRPGFDYAIEELMTVLPVLADRDAPVPRAVSRAIEAILHRRPEIICSPGTYDQKHISRIGHLHDCVAYGPGILDLAHQPDEYVIIEDLVHSAQVMALATLELMGHPLAIR
ncbi:MAG: acetylornithine deacetylase/succinyl-diaminopimelate desuccinylase family protein [Geminicoccaceae bacterium]|nr:acetylornithine deacetylase/succinyl-diaminopimelate desuccinylase family protein [Geminicoccaceae bacterium]